MARVVERGGSTAPGGATLDFERQLWAMADGLHGGGEYADVPGFCKSAPLEEIAAHGFVLTPGRYVGADHREEDGEPFAEKMARLTGMLDGQFAESARLEGTIRENLKGPGFGD